ncbi:MAG: hypothetical protein RLZZ344_562 [Pseudomonadota bacterium]|jgi:hypothetical protein
MASQRLSRAALVVLASAGVVSVAFLAGVQAGLLVLIGIGFGLALQGYGFGFTGGWRRMITTRDPSGMVAQMVLMAIAAVLALPMLAAFPDELVGAVAPVSWSLLIGAFVFGLAMQLADGCGSGSLNKAGAGNIYSWAVMPTFILGSFIGASHQPAWVALGGPLDALATDPAQGLSISLLPILGPTGATLFSLVVCLGVATLFVRLGSSSEQRGALWNRQWLKAALVIGLLYAVHLAVAGQPWGIVYGLGLWGAKVASGLGLDLTNDAFWGAVPHAARLTEPVLWDITSLTNIGLLFGTMAASRWTNPDGAKHRLSARQLAIGLLAGLILGYSARLAFGCNIGGFLGGVASASLHGWVWFAMAFAGSMIGVRLRGRLGLT